MRDFAFVAIWAGAVLGAATVWAGEAMPVASSAPENDKDKDRDEEVVTLSPFEVMAGSSVGYSASTTIAGARLGATPGGFQDINFGRHLLEWGLLPHASEITAEGLFSEFDLPTPEAEKSTRLLTITGDAKVASILNKPEITHLAQLGFSSSLDARTWKRDPVFLVVVADVSGSMDGNLPLLKASIATMLEKLGPKDGFALVSFSDDVQLDCTPQLVQTEARPNLTAAIEQLAIRGGTNIEAGLELGLTVAQTRVPEFSGRTRVVLITDAMPNIGATGPGSFMALAEEASLRGVGLTTIGVGLDFSAEFVKQVSSVSGGNAYYFADAEQMEKRIRDDFDFMVTELAFDIEIRVEPASGFRLSDVYGLPGDVYTRTPQGGIVMDLATLFLSRERGAIFLAFSADRPSGAGPVLGHASLSYVLHGASEPERSQFALTVNRDDRAGLGICRGELLINEYEALRAASAAFYEQGDLAAALAQTQALVTLFSADADRTLHQELELLENVASFLEFAAEVPEIDRRALRQKPTSSPLVGVWRFEAEDAPSRYLILTPAGRAAFLDDPQDATLRFSTWKGRHLRVDGETALTLAVNDATLQVRSAGRAETAESWNLERCRSTSIWEAEVTQLKTE